MRSVTHIMYYLTIVAMIDLYMLTALKVAVRTQLYLEEMNNL